MWPKLFSKRRYVLVGLMVIFIVFLWFWTDATPKTLGTVKIYDAKGLLMYESSGGVRRQEMVSIEEIPKQLQEAVVVIEDKRFYEHYGIDVVATFRAFVQNLRAFGIVSGGSTISQQLVRFTVISPQKPAKLSYFRKIREVLMAVRISLTKSKEEILESYLNSMHFGRGVYGVQSASRIYFGKDVTQLSLAQSAMLAGMVANPSAFDPLRHPEKAKGRRDLVLSQLLSEGQVGEEKYLRAIEELLPNEIHEAEMVAPHFAEMVLLEIDKRDISIEKGLEVHTTIDSDLYNFVLEIARNQVDELRDQHNLTNAAVVVIENSTGEVRVLLGSVDYFNEEIEGQNNMAVALRQPGSAMKPVTYAAAFEQGIATPATMIVDAPKVFPTQDGPGFKPHNYDGRYRGPVLVREALASSYNMPAVEMLSRVGVGTFLNLSHDMGVTSMQETDRYDLALTLGGGEVNLVELTNVFSTFARGGDWVPVGFIEKIISDKGEVLFEHALVEPSRVVSEQVSYLIADILSDNKARIPTFGETSPLNLSIPAAVKTGTTTDWHDNWTVGYAKDYTVGVWVGNANNEPMQDLSGVTGAAPIWKMVMEEISRDSLGGEFEKPEGIVEVEVCAWDGLLPTEACTERYLEKFIIGTVPNQYSKLTKASSLTFRQPIQIISPRNGAFYEVREKAADEELVFELSSVFGVDEVEWELDGEVIDNNECGEVDFECKWKPVAGDHNLMAKVTTEDGEALEIEEVKFRVVEYKEGW